MQHPARKLKYLFVVPSSCQMYSGTGTAIFDWIRFSKEDFDFTLLMDTTYDVNLDAARNFCSANDVGFRVSRPAALPGCPDTGIADVSKELLLGYDVVECVSWANAATNLQVLSAIPNSSTLVYTPHSQPMWTLGEPTRFPCVQPAFSRMLKRSDLVLLDSAFEQTLPCFTGFSGDSLQVVPLGVDSAFFRPGELDREAKTLLCVCDCREHRKRLDLLIAAFTVAHEIDPEIRLTIIGKGSAELKIPSAIESAVSRLGYVTFDVLVRHYQTANTFVLLTDYEAFGLPIAEALACGCSVILNRLEALVDLFSGLPGVSFVTNTDTDEVARALVRDCGERRDSKVVSAAALDRFSFNRTYGLKRELLNRRIRVKAIA